MRGLALFVLGFGFAVLVLPTPQPATPARTQHASGLLTGP